MEIELVNHFACAHLPSEALNLTSQLPDLVEDEQR